MAALKRARARLEAIDDASREPLAIVGMGCRFPGGVDSPQSYWQLLQEGRHGIVAVPPERWDADEFYSDDPQALGKMRFREAGFITDIDRFDAEFFGISPREARRMDPQQRLLLEVAWEALEDAGITRDALGQSETGVFVGVNNSDYFHLQVGPPTDIDT